MSAHPFLSLEHPIRFAHRGSRTLWPENTHLAFDGVVDLGYRYIETDIRVTRDGVVVVFHDETLERTTNGVGAVADWDWDDLQHLDAGYNFSPDGESYPLRGKGVRISRLDDTLSNYPDIHFNIDLKAKRSEWPVADVIVRTRRFDSVLVGGFVDTRTARFRRITKGRVATSAGSAVSAAMYAASRIGRATSDKFEAFQLPANTRGISVDKKLVDAIHATESHIHVWTVDDPERLHELLDLGVDGIVTDRPDVLNEVVEERNTANRES
jgi:glycerophosphoryl diester phosphodiesterase